jgi:glycosyltransferase involved in cell wall biosynthesis
VSAGRLPIRLMKFVCLFGFGGTERQFANLAGRLDRARFEPRFGCMMRWGHFLGEIEAQGIPVSEYRVRSLWKPPALARQLGLAADMRRDRIEIVHSYNFYANVFAVPAARLAGVPVVIASIRDAGVYLTPAQKRVQRFVARFADCVLVNAESIRQWLIGEDYPQEKIRIVRNGIDLSKFAQARSGAGIRRELGLPADAPLVVTLARVNPQKGLEYFIDAAAAVGRRFPDARFLVVGEGLFGHKGGVARDVAYQRELERRAARLGLGERVLFTGFRADVPELLSEASVSVLPSLSEGLSNTLLESMAAGVPAVATTVGGNPELIEDGSSGLLVPPRDAGALARAMVAILGDRDLARTLGEEAKRRVVEHFSLERMVRETEDLYLGLLERKTKRRRAAYAGLTEGETP